VIIFVCIIQGDSGRRVNILGDRGIGHCEIRSYTRVSNTDWLPTNNIYIYIILNNIRHLLLYYTRYFNRLHVSTIDQSSSGSIVETCRLCNYLD